MNKKESNNLSLPFRGTGGVTEKLLHFIWQFGYFNRKELCTTTGDPIQIVAAGQLNKNEGPDFLQARLKIAGTQVAGSVELHVRTSDWEKHGHSTDANYDNVILHVVYEHDQEAQNNMPVLELAPYVPKLLLERYAQLMEASAFVPCAASITEVKELTWLSWKERLLAERLTRKAANIFHYLQQTKHHWEESFWWLLARNFGTKVNADAFELLAQSVPVTLLAKHKNNIHQLEALLFGQAGLLNGDFEDDYPRLLKREYQFLHVKHGLQPIAFPVHFLRMRPQNFPSVRLAQLAMLVHTAAHLFSKIKEEEQVENVRKWLDVTANDYWHYRYRFDEPSAYKPKRVGDEMINNIIINTVVPLLFTYGIYCGNDQYKNKALLWLEKTKPEANALIAGFKGLHIHSQSAYDTQALIELKNEYCNKKRCLECSVGNTLLKTHPS